MTARRESWTVRLWRGGRELDTLDVTDGSVDSDIGAAPTRTCKLSVPAAWVPRVSTDPLDPRSRTELTVTHTVDGSPHPMGVFLLTKSSSKRSASGVSAQVQCPDRSAAVRRALLLRPASVAAGELAHVAVGRVLADRAPWLPQALTPSTVALPAAWAGAAGDDPWSACEKLAAAAGMRLLVDVDGRVTLRALTDPLAGDVAATWRDGADGVTVETSRDLDGTDAVDAVLVPWRDGALLVGPADARAVGKYAGDPSLITSADQAQQVGQAELLLRRGLVEQVAVTVWSDPAVDVGDAVRVVDSVLGADVTARVLGISRSMGSPTMTVKLAARRIDA